MLRLFFFGLILVTNISCQHINTEKELSQIDSLKTIIHDAEIIFKEVDINQVKTVHEQMSNQIMLAKSIYGDSIEWEKAKVLTKYYGVSKSLRKYINKQSYLTEELAFSKQQLMDLSTDLERNIIPIDSFNLYFETECAAAKNLRTVIRSEVNNAKTNMDSYEDFSEQIREVLEGQNAH